MKHPLVAIALAIGMVLTGVLVFTTGARAHEQETSVDWEVAYANIRVLAAPVYTHYTTQTLPLGGTRFAYSGVISGAGAYPTIPTSPDPGLATGDYIVITWSFRYIGGSAVRGDLFWITRLGLDYGTVGRYINGGWIGASSFEMLPNTQFNATLVIRSIQPSFRHLHVGVAVQNVGNIHRRERTGLRTAPGCQCGAVREPATDRTLALGRGEPVRSDRNRIRLHRDHVVVRPVGEEAGGARMNRNDGMNLIPLGFFAWLLCVAGAVIASLPQWFIVALHQPAITAEFVGLPILFIGSVLLVIAWLPERKRRYPEVLENTMTPIPKYYLEEAAKEA